MTKLSMLILAASITRSFMVCCTLLGFVLIIIGIILTIWKCGGFSSSNDKCEKTHKEHKVKTILCYIFAILFWLIAGLMPSEKSIYMIAGVETVNEFSKTEVAHELGESGMSIVKDITKYIHTYTLEAVKQHRHDEDY